MQVEGNNNSDSEGEVEYSLPHSLKFSSEESCGNYKQVIVCLSGNAYLYGVHLCQSLSLQAINHINLQAKLNKSLASIYEIKDSLLVIMNQKLDRTQEKQLLLALHDQYKIAHTVVLTSQLNSSLSSPLFYKQTYNESLYASIKSIYDDYSKEIVDEEVVAFMKKHGHFIALIIQFHVCPQYDLDEVKLYAGIFSELGLKVDTDEQVMKSLIHNEYNKIAHSSLYI